MNWSLPLLRDRNSDGLVDELQLMNLQALSGTLAPASYACVVIISLFRRRCLLLAMLFFACCGHCSLHQLQVRSFDSLFRSCIAPFWTSMVHRVFLDLGLWLLDSRRDA